MDEPRHVEDDPDPGADLRDTPSPLLQRISIREILALQSVFALVMLVESTLLRIPFGAFVIPLVAAFWSVHRTRQFRHVTFVNPFTFTILVSILTHTGYAIARHNSFGVESLVESFVSAIVTGIAFGGMAALSAILVINGWTPMIGRTRRILGGARHSVENESLDNDGDT